MEERGSLLGLRQIYTGFHANGTPGACAKGHRGQIRGDEGYRLGEHHGKSPNPAWSGQGGWGCVQEDFLEGLSEVLKTRVGRIRENKRHSLQRKEWAEVRRKGTAECEGTLGHYCSFFKIHWSIVHLQCVKFCCTAKCRLHIYVYVFFIFFPL